MACSALAERIGTELLVKFACGIAEAAGEKVLEKGLEELFGSDEQKLKNEIADVKRKLEETIGLIRDTKIDSLYNSIIDIFETVVSDSGIADLEKRRERMRDLQKRLDTQLKEAAKEVPESLEQINNFLGEEGNNSNFESSVSNAELCGVYSYWAVVGRGIELLEMATKSPKVHFPEGEKTVVRHIGYLEKQREFFESSVGKATIELYNRLMEVKEEGKLQVWFATNASSGFTKNESALSVGLPIAVANAGWQKWYLTPAAGRKSLDSFSAAAYWLQEIDTGDYLGSTTGGPGGPGHAAGRPVIKGHGRLDFPIQWNWFIKPSAPGSDRFTIRQEESPGWALSVDNRTKAAALSGPLPNLSAELFQILPVDN
ncbi:uncharacterized protein FTJAE_777 [Fusarium tjaetaba]|uniref:Uncharacterized protein n=1 Tax=Fusarium tjaetaba TaxID=1567544 RepID=A0A8H5SDU1_9HYPO|nr:uncharacterized protein FTJAE_777 [Fusarium tjaetaba]KAF5649813.1 hypothetical protein FTJAE_777 [Fusarium tjaetaba]